MEFAAISYLILREGIKLVSEDTQKEKEYTKILFDLWNRLLAFYFLYDVFLIRVC